MCAEEGSAGCCSLREEFQQSAHHCWPDFLCEQTIGCRKLLNKHLKMFSSNSLVKNKSLFFSSVFLWGGVGVAYFTM